MNIALVHIGLHKTATTTLQNVWLNTPGIALVHNELLEIVQLARKFGLGKAKPTDRFSLQFPPSVQQANTKVMLSNEGLSTAYFSHKQDGDLESFRKACAQMICQTAPNAKILLVLRKPEKWIISMYNQAVKEGMSESFPEYLSLKSNLLKRALDIKKLHGTWSASFGKKNILILPMELYKDDPVKFYSLIEQFSGIPAPIPSPKSQVVNKSISEPHLRVMREFNRFANLFVEHGIYHDKQVPPRIEEALSILRFALRWNLEAPPQDLSDKLQEVEQNLPSLDMDVQHIDPEMLREIKAGLRSFWGEADFYGYREYYLS